MAKEVTSFGGSFKGASKAPALPIPPTCNPTLIRPLDLHDPLAGGEDRGCYLVPICQMRRLRLGGVRDDTSSLQEALDRSRRGLLRPQVRTGTWPLPPHSVGRGSPEAAQFQEFGRTDSSSSCSGCGYMEGGRARVIFVVCLPQGSTPGLAETRPGCS